MEELLASLRGLNLVQTEPMRITADQLQNIVNNMRQSAITSMPLNDIIQQIIEMAKNCPSDIAPTPDHSTATPPPPNSEGSVGNDTGFISPSFTFQSPSKPFTPFKVDKSSNKPNIQVSGLSTKEQAVNSSGGHFSSNEPVVEGNINFTGFFNAARNSIPSNFDSSSDSPSPVGGGAGRATPDKENTQANMQPSEQKQIDPGKGWFWGANKSAAPWDMPTLAEKTANIDLNEKSSSATGPATNGAPDFVLPHPSFSLGSGISSASKSRRNKTPNQPSSLPNINSGNGGLSNSNKAADNFIFNLKESTTSVPPHSVGLNGFQTSNGSFNSNQHAEQKVEKKLFSSTGELEDDDEMSVDESDTSPLKDSPFVAPVPENYESKIPDLDHQVDETSKGLPVDDITFNIGSEEHFGLRSARKGSAGSRRKDSGKKGHSRPNSATTTSNPSASLFSNNPSETFPDLKFPQNLESMFSKLDETSNSQTSSGSTAFAPESEGNTDPLSGDAPPSWWSKTGNGVRDEENEIPVEIPPPAFKIPMGPIFGNKNIPVDSETPRFHENTSAKASKVDCGMSSPNREEPIACQDPNLLQLATLYSKQGKELYGIGLYERALDAYTKCLNLAPKDWNGRAIVMGNRAAVYFMMHRYMETVNDCDDALILDPTLVKLYIRKGKSLMCMGHFNPADQAFSRVLEYSSVDFLAPKGPIQLDSDARIMFEEAIDKAKLEAKAGLRDLEKLREAVKELISAEANMDWQKVVKICDENILHKSNMHRAAQIAKANALNEVSRYEDAKAFMEEITLKAPLNIQSLYAHPRAMFPCPGIGSLTWNEIREPPSVQIDISSVKSMVLCMGYELGHTYVISLKNVKASRSCSADVMMKMVALLSEIDTSISNDDKNESWQWVVRELAKLKELISMKNSADQQFKAKNFVGALNSYTAALKLDPTARRWAAILHSNRAATQMSLGLFADAVLDCNNAAAKDSEYARAYLRRARAYRSMNKFNESVRDFRRYLCSDPVPIDFKDVQKELDEMIDLKNKADPKPTSSSAPSSSAGPASSTRPTSATANTGTKSSREPSKFNANFNPFNRPEGPVDDGSRPNSARSTGDWEGKPKSNSYGSYSHNNTYAGYSRPSRSQQQQFHQQQQQQQQQYRSQTQSSSSRFGASWGTNRDFGLGSSDESEEEEIKQKNHYTRSTSSSSKGAFGGNAASGGVNSGGTSSSAGNSSKLPSGLFSLKETDHYIVLGVDTHASDKDIKVAYRKLALQYHPDKNKDPGAEDRFKMISLAYSILSDKGSRREYDLSRPLSGRGRR